MTFSAWHEVYLKCAFKITLEWQEEAFETRNFFMLLKATVIVVPRDLGSECMSINLRNQSTDRYMGRVVAVPFRGLQAWSSLAFLIIGETLIMGNMQRIIKMTLSFLSTLFKVMHFEGSGD